MKQSLKYRAVIGDSRRVVVKVGTNVLVQKTGRPEIRRIRAIVHGLAQMQRDGREVALVTSGAIGAGMEALGMKSRPERLPDLQMAASVGQCRLMARYDKLFSAERCVVGQVLLTRDDFHHKVRLSNARRTMESLLRNKVIPVINENDVVADDEIKAVTVLGDNDRLSALVVKLIRADLLIILSTVDGLREHVSAGESKRVRYIETITRQTYKLVVDKANPLSRGGMMSKLQAAQAVSETGTSVVIADGRRPRILEDIMAGRDVGTFVLASV